MFYHYCCSHSLKAIGSFNCLLRPQPHPLLHGKPPLIWLTDQVMPDRRALGLTSEILPCDRLEHRYLVQPYPAIVSWFEWRAEHTVEPLVLLELELHADPRSWWVCEVSLPATYDKSYRPGSLGGGSDSLVG